MFRKFMVFVWCCAAVPCSGAAYFEDYPPYPFGSRPLEHLLADDLFEGKTVFRSADGKIVLAYEEDKVNGEKTVRFEVGRKKVWERNLPSIDTPRLYQADLDKNGLNDYIVISWGGGTGLGGSLYQVDLLLGRNSDGFDWVSYVSFEAGLQGIVDLDGDGRYEILVMDMYGGKNHNYFVHAVYKIKEGRLVNVSGGFKGFPKFIWFTHKRNDQDTTHLTREERKRFMKEMDGKIEYRKLIA